MWVKFCRITVKTYRYNGEYISSHYRLPITAQSTPVFWPDIKQKREGKQKYMCLYVFNRPGVAGAVLQTAL